jgi:hypothetical protein
VNARTLDETTQNLLTESSSRRIKMNDFQAILKSLLPDNLNLFITPANEMLDYISERIYLEGTHRLRDEEVFNNLPRLLKDIFLLIDFDTELNMNGILGYLENSTGKYIDETIEVLLRIGALKDGNALRSIMKILSDYRLSTGDLHNNLLNTMEYQIISFIQTHRINDIDFYDRIQQEADNLYLYNQDTNIFDILISYIESNKQHLIDEINKNFM